MSIPVRQSTARTVMVGPILDADGVVVTDAVIGDMKLSKDGAAAAALNGSATLTHDHAGNYRLGWTASDVDTVGGAQVTLDDAPNVMPRVDLTVIEEAVYDALFAADAAGYLTNAVLTDSVPADGSFPTPSQALYMLTQFLLERSVSGTTLTVRKPDGTTALMTFTLNDATQPTSITRTT